MSTSLKPAMQTPTSNRGGSKPSTEKNTTFSQSSAIALNMSWQLLVITVLPIVGGHLLDTHYDTSPVWVVAGMVVGLIGTIVVVRQTVRQLNDVMRRSTEEHEK